jgi:hypothetical protein
VEEPRAYKNGAPKEPERFSQAPKNTRKRKKITINIDLLYKFTIFK